MRLRRVALLVLLAGLVRPAPAGAQDPLGESRRAVDDARAAVAAAQEAVDEAQQSANVAAEELFAAIEEQEALEVQTGELRDRIATTLEQADLIATEVRTVVVTEYVGAQSAGGLLDDGDLNKSVLTEALSRYVAGSRLEAIDEYRVVRGELDELEAQLAERSARQSELVDVLATARIDADERLAELTTERARLDALVAEAESEQARLVAAEAARQAEEEQARLAAEEEARRQAPVEPTPTAAPPDQPTTPTPTGADAPDPEIPPAAPPSPATGWVCPVAGPTSFIDSWGAPRAGGRLHQGTDMMAVTGVPVVAVVDGTIEHRSNSLGGLAAHLSGADGNYFYYAHLSAYENEGAGFVAQGTVIGYVGMTGDAPVPHLHFEYHPGGRGNPVNPYPTLIASC